LKPDDIAHLGLMLLNFLLLHLEAFLCRTCKTFLQCVSKLTFRTWWRKNPA